MDNQIYNAQNVRTALVNSTIPGVLAMDVNQCVYVLADDWENCLREISELSGTKWNKKRKTVGVPGGSVRYSETFVCHRAGVYTPQRSVRIAQKDSKKCGCTARIKITIRSNRPGVCEIVLLSEHTNHVPGDLYDVRTLPLTRSTVQQIEQQLRIGSNYRDIRISMLRQLDEVDSERTAGQRRVNYEDVYNMMTRVLDLFTSTSWYQH